MAYMKSYKENTFQKSIKIVLCVTHIFLLRRIFEVLVDDLLLLDTSAALESSKKIRDLILNNLGFVLGHA